MSKEHKDHEEAHHEHTEHHHKSGPKMNWGTVALVLVLVFAATLVATWAGFAAGNAVVAPQKGSSVIELSATDKAALSGNIESYINSNLLPADQNVNAKVSDANDLGNGFYQFNVDIYQNGTSVQQTSVYESGGQLILGQILNLSKPLPKPETPTNANTQPTASTAPVKSDKPKVDLYVMSFCPYGNQAEDTFVPDFNLLKNQIDFNVHFIVSVDGNNVQSLHGPAEVTEDMREACVAKYYGNVAWLNTAVYVNNNCGSPSTTSCFADAAKAFNIDNSKIETCVANEGVALMKENEAASTAAGASGSPTLIINGVNSSAVYQYGNSEAYKTAICGSFNNAPAECNVTLSSATSTTQGGSCGN